MSRRSARLVSGDDSDSSSVTNVSYRESPVRVFKKKAGSRKAASRTSSRANSNASSAGAETSPSADQHDGTQQTVVSVPFVATTTATTTATPRPALTPARSRSQTPCHSQSDVPKESRAAGLYSSSRPGGHNTPHTQEMNLNSIDSSGYSSSEAQYQRPTSAKSDGTCNTGHSTEYLSPSPIAPLVEVAQARVKLLTDLANASRGKKAACLLLFLIIVLLSIWFLFPWLASLMPRGTVLKTQTQAEPRKQPVVPPLPLSPPPNTRPVIPTVDPAIVSAVVEKKMQGLLEEMLLKQENHYSQLEERMQERMQLDLQGVRARVEAGDTDSRLHLEKEVSALRTQIEEYQTHSHTASNSLNHRVEVVEADNVKLSQELLSIQMTPPPAPCPDPVTMPVHNQLTPELQQAMEKWLMDRIKEQDMDGAVSKESSTETDYRRPMADKMADFALETQGASVVSTKCSETFRIRSACVTLFGFPLWYPSESPRTVIQGYPVLLPGKCWAFHGVQGILVLSLSHPVRITHVTLDHLPRCNSPTGRIDSAPKDFHVYGMIDDTEEGALIGQFTYNEDGESTQTFELPDPTNVVYRFVELRVLSNWGHMEYTCLYRFRVHGKIAST